MAVPAANEEDDGTDGQRNGLMKSLCYREKIVKPNL